VGENKKNKPNFGSHWLISLGKKLASWKGKHFSFASKVCLIKTILTTLPLYHISFYMMPSLVEKYIRKIQLNFLWVGKVKLERYHRVK